MVDNRSAGFFGIGGAFNFKSGDISGTAAKTNDEKYGPGTEYGVINRGEGEEEQQFQEEFTDRSAQLRATLNSLAMMNVAAVINSKKPKKQEAFNFNDLENETEEIIKENSKHGQDKQNEQKDEENLLDDSEQDLGLFTEDDSEFEEEEI